MRKKRYLILFMSALMMTCSCLSPAAFASSGVKGDMTKEMEMQLLSSSSPELHFWCGYGSELVKMRPRDLARILMSSYVIDNVEIERDSAGTAQYKLVLKSKFNSERVSVTVPQGYTEDCWSDYHKYCAQLRPWFEYYYKNIHSAARSEPPEIHNDSVIKMHNCLSHNIISEIFIEPWVSYCYEQMLNRSRDVQKNAFFGWDLPEAVFDVDPLQNYTSGRSGWKDNFYSWYRVFAVFIGREALCMEDRYYSVWDSALEDFPYDPLHIGDETVVADVFEKCLNNLEKIEKVRPSIFFALFKRVYAIFGDVFLNYMRYYAGGILIPRAFNIKNKVMVDKYIYMRHLMDKLKMFLLSEMLDAVLDDIGRSPGRFDEATWLEAFGQIENFAKLFIHGKRIQVE